MLAFWVGFFDANGSLVHSSLVNKCKKNNLLEAYNYACSEHRKEFVNALCVDMYSFILCHIPLNQHEAMEFVLDCKPGNYIWF